MIKVKTAMGFVMAEEYNDGIANGIKLIFDNDIVAMLDVYSDGSQARLLVYESDSEPTQVINL